MEMAMALSSKALEVLASLRAHVEGSYVEGGSTRPGKWGSVYLDNARPKGMSARSFAGYLSALEREGLYRSQGDKCFGDVQQDPVQEMLKKIPNFRPME
jgi:hypothetical protein